MGHIRKATAAEITAGTRDDVFASPKELADAGIVAGGGGGGTPSGSDGYIQFKTGTAFDSDSNLFFDKTNKYFAVGSSTTQITTESFLQLVKNDDAFRSIAIQNLSSGNLACGDFTAYRDDTTGTTNFASFGVNSSTYTDPSYPIQDAGSGYAFMNGGKFVIGTQTGHDVVFHTGGTALTDRAMVIRGNGGQKGYIGILEGSSFEPTLLGKLHIVNEDDTKGTFFIDRYSPTSGQTSVLTFRKARGTGSAPTAVQTDDGLGGISLRGYGTTGFSSTGRASIIGRAGEVWNNTQQGAYLQILTTPNGGTATAEALRITNSALTTPSTSYDIFNTTTTTLNFGGAVTTLTIGGVASGTITHNYSTNTTTTGQTKTVNIGTGGASGSTTAINIGSATSGATNNITFNLASSATGDIWYRNSSGYLTRLGIGSAGQVLQVSSGLPSWQTPTGGASNWGSAYQYSETGLNADNPFATASKTLITGFTTGSLTNGTYLIEWYFEINRTTTTMQPTITCEYTGTVVGRHVGRTVNTANYDVYSGFYRVSSMSGVHNIELYYQGSNTATANIRNARVQIYRLS
jgi:hypothetical protein